MEGRERVDDRGRGHSAAAEEHRRLHGVRCGGEVDDYQLQSNPVDFSTRRCFLIAHTILQIGKHEGRAGMAALQLNDGCDVEVR